MMSKEGSFDDRIKYFIEAEVDQDNVCTAYVLVATIQNFVTTEEKF